MSRLLRLIKAVMTSTVLLVLIVGVGVVVLNMRLGSGPDALPVSFAEMTEMLGEPEPNSGSGLVTWKTNISVGEFVLLEKALGAMVSDTETAPDGTPAVETVFLPTWTALEVLHYNGVTNPKHAWGAGCFWRGGILPDCETWG